MSACRCFFRPPAGNACFTVKDRNCRSFARRAPDERNPSKYGALRRIRTSDRSVRSRVHTGLSRRGSRVRVPSAAPFTSPPEFTTPNSPSSNRRRAAWLQQEEVALPGILPSRRAAVVQSVRIPACHAGGRPQRNIQWADATGARRVRRAYQRRPGPIPRRARQPGEPLKHGQIPHLP